MANLFGNILILISINHHLPLHKSGLWEIYIQHTGRTSQPKCLLLLYFCLQTRFTDPTLLQRIDVKLKDLTEAFFLDLRERAGIPVPEGGWSLRPDQRSLEKFSFSKSPFLNTLNEGESFWNHVAIL